MQVIITGPSGANLRRTPVLGAPNVIRVVPAGTILDYTTTVGDFYAVTGGYIHVSVAQAYITPVVTPLDYVPYKSQWDTDADNRTSDCGQTCVAMLSAYKGMMSVTNNFPFQQSPNGLSIGSDLVANFAQVHIEAHDKFIDDPVNQLPSNSICLIWYGGFNRKYVQDKGFTGLHWLVFLNYVLLNNKKYALVHDPDFWGDSRNWGENHLYPLEDWLKAFIPVGGYEKREIVTI